MEKHLAEIEINGKRYPLNYSIAASRRIVGIGVLSDDATMQDSFERNVKYLYLLMQEGADFQRRFCGSDEELDLTEEDLLSYFSPGDMDEIVKAVQQAQGNGKRREVEAKPVKKAEAAKGKSRQAETASHGS